MESSRIAFIRNFIFGVEDSLVSTVGLLSGIAIAGMTGREIFVTGVVLIFVEAFSMAAGSFLSESSADEAVTHSERVSKKSYLASLIMFLSYFVSGFIPLAPYLALPVALAFPSSIAASLVALVILGAIGARLSKTRVISNALRMLIIGGLAIGIGVGVGHLLGA